MNLSLASLLSPLLVWCLRRLMPLEEALSAVILAHAKEFVAEEGRKAQEAASKEAQRILNAAIVRADSHQAAVNASVAKQLATIAKAVSPITPEGATALVAVATQSVLPSGSPLPDHLGVRTGA